MTSTIRTLASAVVAASLALAAPAMGATVTVNTTIDVSDIGPLGIFTGGAQGSPPFSPPYDVSLAEGDTFEFTIDFLGNQQLTIDNLTFIWAFSFADEESDVEGTGSFSFLDVNGNVILTSTPKTTVEGRVHFGHQIFASDFTSLPASVTFGGVRFVGTVDDYVETGVTVRNYNEPALFFDAGSFRAVGVPAPEMGTLMLLGIAAIAGMRRRSARN